MPRVLSSSTGALKGEEVSDRLVTLRSGKQANKSRHTLRPAGLVKEESEEVVLASRREVSSKSLKEEENMDDDVYEEISEHLKVPDDGGETRDSRSRSSDRAKLSSDVSVDSGLGTLAIEMLGEDSESEDSESDTEVEEEDDPLYENTLVGENIYENMEALSMQSPSNRTRKSSIKSTSKLIERMRRRLSDYEEAQIEVILISGTLMMKT